ncbi:MAG: hypothetical protein V7642_6353 [Burkholderiales bacterium]
MQKSHAASIPTARLHVVSSSREMKNATRRGSGMGWLRSEANQQPIQSILTPAEFEFRWGSAKATGTAVG